MTKEDIILCGYPRSGHHWLRYILEYFTQKNSFGNLHGEKLIKAQQPLRLDYAKDLGKAIDDMGEILFSHAGQRHKLKNYFDDKTKFIFPLRNYKECVIRHQSKRYKHEDMNEDLLWNCIQLKIDKETMFDEDKLPTYLDHLFIFDSWEGKTLLVYYEDLMEDFSKTLTKILNFLDVDLKKKKPFLKNLKKHKTNSLNFYGNYIAKPESDGKIFHHQNHVDKSILDGIDNKIKECHLYDKYLKRYGE